MTVPDPNRPGDPPPHVPPEYAEAYRRGYERAFREALGEEADPGDDPADDPAHGPAGDPFEAGFDEPSPEDPATGLVPGFDVTGPQEPVPVAPPPPVRDDPSTRGTPSHRDDSQDHRADRPGWFVPALLACLVLALVLGAYGIGRLFSATVGSSAPDEEPPDGVVVNEDGSTDVPPGDDDGGDGGGKEDGKPKQKPEKDAYGGRTEVAAVGGSSATCRAPSSVDAAGNPVTYPASNAHDGDLTTAWRCNGDGVGQSITLTLAEEAEIGEVGIVPGYAKTDPASGEDRYAENNRLTRVRWTFADGSQVVQRLDGSPGNRSMQTRRIAPTRSDSVVIEVLASTPGERDTIAVSELRVGRVAG
jgi:hypothetical protein